jgi:hypothetical protein
MTKKLLLMDVRACVDCAHNWVEERREERRDCQIKNVDIMLAELEV